MLCYPESVMWVIPGKKSKDIIPLRNVSGVSIERYNDWKRFFIGLLLSFIGALFFVLLLMMVIKAKSFGNKGNILGYLIAFIVVFIIGSILMMASANKCLIIFCNGNEYDIEVPFYELKKLYRIQRTINKALNYEADKYDMNLKKTEVADEIGKAVGKAIKDNK